MFCPLALGVLDTLVWWFEIAFMATLFEIEGHFNFEVVEKIADGRMGAVFRAYQVGSEGFAKEVFPDKVPAASRWAKRVMAPGFCSACSGTCRAKGHCRLRSSRRNTEPA